MNIACLRRAAVGVAALFAVATAAAAVVIDDFGEGTVALNARGSWLGGPAYLESSEAGLRSTVRGSRLTWVDAGRTGDGIAAQLATGAMRFRLDNDEARGGLLYRGLGGVDVLGFDNDRLVCGYEFDRQSSDVLLSVTIRDTAGREQTAGSSLGGAGGRTAGIAELPLENWYSVDLKNVQDVELRLSGGMDYVGSFWINDLAVVPEPATILLIGLLAILRRR